MTESPTVSSAGTIELRCHARDCHRREHVQAKHLPNLLAAGPWLCAGCRPQEDQR